MASCFYVTPSCNGDCTFSPGSSGWVLGSLVDGNLTTGFRTVSTCLSTYSFPTDANSRLTCVPQEAGQNPYADHTFFSCSYAPQDLCDNLAATEYVVDCELSQSVSSTVTSTSNASAGGRRTVSHRLVTAGLGIFLLRLIVLSLY